MKCNQETACTTYFHSIPIDALINIIHFVEDTEAYANNQLLISVLFSPVSPFHHVSASIFKTIILDSDRTLNCLVKRGTIELGGHDEYSLTPYVLRRISGSLQRIQVIASGMKNYEQFVALLLQHCDCTEIRALEFLGVEVSENFQATIEVLVGCFRGQLETLEFPSYSSACSKYTGALISTCSKLRRFSYYGGGLIHLEGLWPAVSDTLEEIYLAICDDSDWKVVSNSVRFNCKNLTSINIFHGNGGTIPEDEYKDLLLHYSKRLVEARVDFLGMDSLKTIGALCKNLKVSFKETGNDFERIGAIGKRIESLVLILQSSENMTSLEQAMGKCDNLNSLIISGWSESIVFKRICCRNSRLKHLKRLKCSLSASLEEISVLSSCITGLEELEITCGTLMKAEEFRLLANRNKNLEKVEICERLDDRYESNRDFKEVIGCLEKVVVSFKGCEKMKNLSIGLNSCIPERHELRRVCLPLRPQGVYVRLYFVNSTYQEGRGVR